MKLERNKQKIEQLKSKKSSGKVLEEFKTLEQVMEEVRKVMEAAEGETSEKHAC